MNKLSRLFVPVVFVLIGLVAGMNLQPPAVAQDKAQQKNKQKWEYRIVLWNFNLEAPEKMESQLHKLGEEGFEIDTQAATPSSIVYTLKRSE